MLYPLFVHNIGALLYHPTNQPRTSQVMAAAERRKQDHQMRNAQPPAGLPSLQQQPHHHHHSMALPGPHPLPSHPGMTRPALDRAHTFPTPPTSASSVMGGMGTSDSFQWSQQGMASAQGANPMSIDTGLTSTRSMPATPATTPPGPPIQNAMQSYPPVSQSYDSSRQLYNPPSTQNQAYPPSNATSQDRSIYGQANYVKSGMGPPATRPAGTVDQADTKPPNGMMHPGHGTEAVPQAAHEEEAEHEHDAEYTHDSSAYDASRAQYNYNPAPVASLQSDHPHLSPEMTGSPHQAGSGRATPRTTGPQYYGQHGYNTPPRAQGQSSSLYNVMSNDRGPANGAPAGDAYAPQADMGGSMPNGYATQQPVMNGNSGGMKRGRDDEDDGSTSVGSMDPKRRKTFADGSIPSPTYETQMNRPAPAAIATQRRR